MTNPQQYESQQIPNKKESGKWFGIIPVPNWLRWVVLGLAIIYFLLRYAFKVF